MQRNKELRNANARLKALMSEAEKHELEIGIPIKLYLRAARNLITSMYSYLDDKDIESAYILASKFIILFVELLPKHPEYRNVSKEIKEHWNNEVKKTLNGAEKMKKMILEDYEEQAEIMQKEDEKQAEIQKKYEEERKFNAEKQWLEDQESKFKAKEHSEMDNLQNFLAGAEPDKPEVNRALKPTAFSLNIDQANNSYNWRSLVVPKTIFENFLTLAQSNTNRNIETCGILCGKITGGQLTLTTVVLPKQSGTSDSCYTQSEEELYDYVDHNNLITLGWIHTHPTQTAFLSSVDLHTQFSYQIMLPEAVAIVCSPKYNQNALFSLTPHYGLDFIKNCRQSGFHPHPTEPKLYEESPHIVLSTEFNVTFKDLRQN